MLVFTIKEFDLSEKQLLDIAFKPLRTFSNYQFKHAFTLWSRDRSLCGLKSPVFFI